MALRLGDSAWSRRRGTGKPRENALGSDPDPDSASSLRFLLPEGKPGVVGVSALALGVSAGRAGGGIRMDKAAGWNPAPGERRAGQPLLCPRPRREDRPAGRRRARGSVATPRHPQCEGTANSALCIPEHRRDAVLSTKTQARPAGSFRFLKACRQPQPRKKGQAGEPGPRWGARRLSVGLRAKTQA